MMRAVRQAGTEPELAVRRILTSLGVRYRVNVRSLPGSPDIANLRRGWAIFVHGCFWHGHTACPKNRRRAGAQVPRGNRPYWQAKLEDNRLRDARKVRRLRALGVRVLTVWECQLAHAHRLAGRLRTFVGGAVMPRCSAPVP